MWGGLALYSGVRDIRLIETAINDNSTAYYVCDDRIGATVTIVRKFERQRRMTYGLTDLSVSRTSHHNTSLFQFSYY